ncbi:hypothetical protein KXW98_004169 [Aspergillus fumigatus]|nr:hypothetical protein KXX47_004772 [Aspergillus fumigatus]KAH1378303.1 hypothetical protein KXX10_009067 [Aspergillus fumigatus]KAH1418750.1 hypothetical protein KXX64_002199 [Aspergillus fumigatus]KAH1498364.1 hypothetical protein KXX52_000812 [Aspergillus fumigatus]KAH1549214.1 hypothetical protein KXX37_001442 [Aspergillus fumigatus]
MPAPPAYPPARALFNFSPQWFVMPQGTAIISVILHQLHYQFGALRILAKIVWIYTIVLLAMTLFLYILRLIRYPREVCDELRHNLIETSCLASIVITYTTIVQMVALQYGSTHGVAIGVYVLWWIAAFLSTLAVIGIPFVQLKVQPSSFERIPPAILLPVIAALTCAAGGGVICTSTALSPRLQVPVIIVAYLLVGAGISLALGFDAVILFQHFSDQQPSPQKVWQDMILCGPFGQGGFALQILGGAVQKSFPAYARGTLLRAQAAGPIAAGVYTNCAVQLGKIMDSPAFDVWSTALLLLLVIIAIVNTLFTIKGIITGEVLGLEHGWRKEAYQDDKEA